MNLNLSRIHAELGVITVNGTVNGWDGTLEHQQRCHNEFQYWVTGLIKNNPAAINNAISNFIIPRANQHLHKMTLSDFLDLINTGGSGLPQC